MKTDSEEATLVVNDHHWIAEIEKGQAGSEIASFRAKLEKEEMRNEEVRLRLYVQK